MTKTEICANENDFDYVIDCTGHARIESHQDLRGVKGETLLVRNKEFSLQRPVRLMHPRYPLYIVPRADHVFMIGATVIEGAGHTEVTVRSALELLSAAYSLHPSFSDAQILDIRAGIRPAYDDNLPKIKIDGQRIVCNGMFRHGYLLAPVMAQCIADHIEQKQNEFMPLFTEENNESHNQRTHQRNQHAA
jgi:glycine oxidase